MFAAAIVTAFIVVSLAIVGVIALVVINTILALYHLYVIVWKTQQWLWVHLTVFVSRVFYGSSVNRLKAIHKNREMLTARDVPTWVPLSIGNLFVMLDRFVGVKQP